MSDSLLTCYWRVELWHMLMLFDEGHVCYNCTGVCLNSNLYVCHCDRAFP